MPNYEDKLKLKTTELWNLSWDERLGLLNPVKKDIKEIVLNAPSKDKKSTFDWPAFEAKVGLFSRLCTTLAFWLGGVRPGLHPMAEVLNLIVYDKRCPEDWACDFLACFQRQGVNLFEQKRLARHSIAYCDYWRAATRGALSIKPSDSSELPRLVRG